MSCCGAEVLERRGVDISASRHFVSCMSNLTRIQNLSHKFRSLFLLVLGMLPVIYAASWAFIDRMPDFSRATELPFAIDGTLPLQAKVLGFLASLLPMAIDMLGLWVLAKLFKLYAEGKIFTIENVYCYRKLGYLLLAAAITGPIHQSLLSIVLTLHNPPGQRMLSVSLSSSDFSRALMGGIVLLISWVMEEGRKLEDEQAFTV